MDAILKVDPKRVLKDARRTTGIFVRALHKDKWGSHDICELDEQSLLAWLRSRGGNNPLAEDVIGLVMGHGHLHPVNGPMPDTFAWNKPESPIRKGIEAFLREMQGVAMRDNGLGEPPTEMVRVARVATILWLVNQLDKRPTELASK